MRQNDRGRANHGGDRAGGAGQKIATGSQEGLAPMSWGRGTVTWKRAGIGYTLARISPRPDVALARPPPPAAPPGASVTSTVVVPASMGSSPFNTARTLLVAPDFTISVYVRIGGARFMAVTPDGNLLVSKPRSGSVVLVRPNGAGDPLITDYVTGLKTPHDIVFHTIGVTTYVYISETNQVNRYVYTAGALTPGARQVVVSGLPDASTAELKGTYGHELKNIALDGNDKLYVSIASTCNVCEHALGRREQSRRHRVPVQ